jgi:hypothetical protein
VARKSGRLTRADLEKIVDGMSARDVFRASSSNGTDPASGMQQAEAIFDIAAERQGWGEKALDRVHISDTAHLSTLLSESLNLGGPKAEDTEASPVSADTGDSAPS